MHSPNANILLIGPRAAGKTTVGRLLAARLQRPFVDLDELTLRAFCDSATVSQAWRTHGEAKWRAAEAAALERVMLERGKVIALGGGTPTLSAAQSRIRKARGEGEAVVVYLQTTPAMLRQRLTAEAGDRPPLRGGARGNPVDEVEVILRDREPVYLALADVNLDAALSAREVVEAMIASLELPVPSSDAER